MTMTDNDTLLNYVAQSNTTGLEDAATNALSFILSRSTSVRQALSDFLELSVARAEPWRDAYEAEPDLSCFDEDGNRGGIDRVQIPGGADGPSARHLLEGTSP